MKVNNFILGFFIFLSLSLSLVSAYNQPNPQNPIQIFSITQPDSLDTSLNGQECDTLYETSDGYCSEDIRQYYQCLASDVNIYKWTPRSENCGTYSETMHCGYDEDGKAQCLPGKGNTIKYVILIGGIIIVGYLLMNKRKR